MKEVRHLDEPRNIAPSILRIVEPLLIKFDCLFNKRALYQPCHPTKVAPQEFNRPSNSPNEEDRASWYKLTRHAVDGVCDFWCLQIPFSSAAHDSLRLK
jgi:hypothetical protein